MTPNELAKLVHNDLSPHTPRLAAALNRALADMGSGLIIAPGQNPDQPVVYHEKEIISLKGADPAAMIIVYYTASIIAFAIQAAIGVLLAGHAARRLRSYVF